MVSARAAHRFVEPFDGNGIGAGDDHELAVAARLHCRLDLEHGFIERNDLLAGEVSAFFRNDLVFDLHRGDAGALEFLDRPVEFDGVAVPGVDIGDERHVDGRGHPARLFEHFRHGEQPDVGEGELRVGDAGAGRVDHRKSGGGDKPCGQGVIGSRRDDEFVAFEDLPKLLLLLTFCHSIQLVLFSDAKPLSC